jgi:hypothetical protein
MAAPTDESLDLPKRSPGAAWGTAHLAWGMAIFLGLLYVAWQLPVESSPKLEWLALVIYFVSLVWLALRGWQNVERGWRLRHSAACEQQLPTAEMLLDICLGVVWMLAVLRGQEARVLATGLDRLASAMLTVCAISIFLWGTCHATAPRATRNGSELAERRLTWLRMALAVVILVLVGVMEAMAW